MRRGQFYLVPVPIGNLKDITLRAIEVLKQVDLILAEDTRTSGVLLSEYEIETPLLSYHEHNEQSRVKQISDMLESGYDIALISDAGTPCISDPGSIIVKSLIDQQFQVIALPGANAALTCLAASGLNTDRFTFIGFLPVKGKQRADLIREISDFDQTIILYEAPHRVLKTLGDLKEANFANRNIVIGRELTKKYESYFRATVEQAFNHYKIENPRGEFVLILEGKLDYLQRNPAAQADKDFSAEQKAVEDLKKLIAGGMHTKSAANFLSEKYQINKNELYQIALKLQEEA